MLTEETRICETCYRPIPDGEPFYRVAKFIPGAGKGDVFWHLPTCPDPRTTTSPR